MTYFGMMLVQFGIMWHITLESQSGKIMTLFIVAGFLPMFFVSPFAGVWADRYNRKYLINISDATIAVFTLTTAFAILFGVTSYAILFVCAFIRSIGQGVQRPAVGAFITQIVPKEHLTRVNGVQSSIDSFITLASPMLSGALMNFAPLHVLFFVDVATSCIGISILAFLVKAPADETAAAPDTKQKGSSYFHELLDGFRYIKNHGYILRLFTLFAVFLILIAPAAWLTPLQAARKFGAEVWRLTAVEVAFSLGAVGGGILVSVWGGLKNRVHTIGLSYILSGSFALLLGIVPFFTMYLIIMGVVGIAMPLRSAQVMVILQTKVESLFIGRVLSVFSMIISTMLPMGMLIFGPLADVVSIDVILIISGALILLLAIPTLTSKILREAGVITNSPALNIQENDTLIG